MKIDTVISKPAERSAWLPSLVSRFRWIEKVTISFIVTMRRRNSPRQGAHMQSQSYLEATPPLAHWSSVWKPPLVCAESQGRPHNWCWSLIRWASRDWSTVHMCMRPHRERSLVWSYLHTNPWDSESQTYEVIKKQVDRALLELSINFIERIASELCSRIEGCDRWEQSLLVHCMVLLGWMSHAADYEDWLVMLEAKFPDLSKLLNQSISIDIWWYASNAFSM